MDKNKLQHFKHSIQLNIRYMDLDTMHHVNNARYLNFLEEARIDYSQQVMGGLQNINQLSFVVARIEIDYLQAVLFDDQIKIYNRIAEIGNKSLQFESVVERIASPNKIAAKALQVLVAFDSKTGKSKAITDKLRKKITDFENN